MLLVLTLLALQSTPYVPPKELFVDRTFAPPVVLIGSKTTQLVFWEYPELEEISFGFQTRSSPTNAWQSGGARQRQSVSFHISAVAPIYAWQGHQARLIVLGVSGTAENPTTSVERWTPQVAVSPMGQSSLHVQRTPLFSSPDLTHIWSAAAVQDGSALLGLHWESSDLVKIDLTTGTRTVLMTKAQYPTLGEYGRIRILQHLTLGDVYLLTTTRGHSLEASANLMMLLWDPDSDGTPNSIEEFPREEWSTRGYGDPALWEPSASFTANWNKGV